MTTEAFALIRSMIGRVVLTPRPADSGLDAELHGVVANILAVCSEANAKTPSVGAEVCLRSLVAGAGSDLYRTNLRWRR
jgi:hypothetical protein